MGDTSFFRAEPVAARYDTSSFARTEITASPNVPVTPTTPSNRFAAHGSRMLQSMQPLTTPITIDKPDTERSEPQPFARDQQAASPVVLGQAHMSFPQLTAQTLVGERTGSGLAVVDLMDEDEDVPPKSSLRDNEPSSFRSCSVLDLPPLKKPSVVEDHSALSLEPPFIRDALNGSHRRAGNEPCQDGQGEVEDNRRTATTVEPLQGVNNMSSCGALRRYLPLEKVVDLTLEPDDHNSGHSVLIKQEPADDGGASLPAFLTTIDPEQDERDLQYQLKEVELQLKQVQIQRALLKLTKRKA